MSQGLHTFLLCLDVIFRILLIGAVIILGIGLVGTNRRQRKITDSLISLGNTVNQISLMVGLLGKRTDGVEDDVNEIGRVVLPDRWTQLDEAFGEFRTRADQIMTNHDQRRRHESGG